MKDESNNQNKYCYQSITGWQVGSDDGMDIMDGIFDTRKEAEEHGNDFIKASFHVDGIVFIRYANGETKEVSPDNIQFETMKSVDYAEDEASKELEALMGYAVPFVEMEKIETPIILDGKGKPKIDFRQCVHLKLDFDTFGSLSYGVKEIEKTGVTL